MGGGRRCVVLNCENRYTQNRKRGISFHEVPCDLKQRKLWLKQLKPYINPYRLKELFHVCGEHFEEKYFLPSKRRLLLRSAIPTIFNMNESGFVRASNNIKENGILTQDGADSGYPLSHEELNETENVEKDDETSSLLCEDQTSQVEIKEEDEHENEEKGEEKEESKYLFNSVKIYNGDGRGDICRVCFKAAFRHKKLTNRHCTRTQTYKEMMEFLALDVNYDFYPEPVICVNCVMMLLNAYDFKKKCMKTEKALQKYYSNRASTGRPTNLLIIAYGRKKTTENEITIEINNEEGAEKHDNLVTGDSAAICGETNEPIENEECEEIKLLTVEEPPSEVKEEEEEEEEVASAPPSPAKYKRITEWGDPPYLCDMCGRMFKNKRQCRRHLRVHRLQNETVESFTCEVCKFTFNNINVAVHMDSHRKKRYQCNFCERQFDKRNLMATHVRAAHESAPYVECEVCGMRCVRKHLSYHMTKHFDRKDARCQVCDKVVYRSYLKQHARLHFVSMHRSRSVCHICGKTVLDYLMNAHVRRHTETPKYVCKVCDIKFFSVKNLQLHSTRKKHIRNLMLHELTRKERGGEESKDD